MTDLITGNTVRWSYTDGPAKGKTFEHTFGTDGSVTYRIVDGGAPSASATAPAKDKKPPIHYEVERINDDVFAVSYLSPDNGYTLTSILDGKAGTVVSFASNDKEVVVQHGTFQLA
jgi:hypothetical protein